MNFKPLSDGSQLLRMKMFISFSVFTLRAVCPCQTIPPEQAGIPDNPVSLREEGRHGCVLCSSYLLATSEPSMPREAINVPWSCFPLSHGLLQKLRQMHSRTQGELLLFTNTEDKGPHRSKLLKPLRLVQTGHPDHSMLLWFGL